MEVARESRAIWMSYTLLIWMSYTLYMDVLYPYQSLNT